jgi:dihydrodipicolinate synthase/N-acetylneuraminate lyase
MHFMVKDINPKKRTPLPDGCIVDLVTPQNAIANEVQYPKLISLCQWHANVRPDGTKKKQKKIENFTKGITILSHTGVVMMMNANERTRIIACAKGSLNNQFGFYLSYLSFLWSFFCFLFLFMIW